MICPKCKKGELSPELERFEFKGYFFGEVEVLKCHRCGLTNISHEIAIEFELKAKQFGIWGSNNTGMQKQEIHLNEIEITANTAPTISGRQYVLATQQIDDFGTVPDLLDKKHPEYSKFHKQVPC